MREGSRRAKHSEKAEWPSVKLQMAHEDAQRIVLEITCSGPPSRPHDRVVLARVGRGGSGPAGVYLLDGSAEWDTVDGADGFRHGTEYPTKTQPQCPHCPVHPRLTAVRLRAWLDNMERQGLTKYSVEIRRLVA